ncbi:hypothetical protein HF289_08955 [Acidithiobacillus ferrooxidans]|uniref:OB-fold protein n=1 Tax=Acidithiobacillus ferrooxidans TaxID=920 RepID=UPI001C0768F6|nr:hypothetical protein [Acidithiobacillus ferrooxidans]MBU2856998.1 hypothetical protein [Acidithiobacillus ferrooxidans]MBU2860291.1 hypothetical protein [Acidithiobacillus ferrooxidans]
MKRLFSAAVIVGLSISCAFGGTTSATLSPEQIINILSQNSQIPGCSSFDIRESVTTASNDFKMGNYVMAQAGAYIAAKQVAYCAIHQHEPLSEAGNIVGNLLVLSTLSSAKADMIDAQVVTLAHYAKILLTDYPGSTTKAYIEDMKRSGLFGAPKPPRAESMSAIKVSAVGLVKEFNGNSFAFKHKYNKKTLLVSGVVSSITGDGHGGANVALDGAPGMNINDKGFNDYVYCDVSKANVSQAMSITKGKNISIEGVYDPAEQKKLDGGITLIPIDLFSCKVLG